MPKKSVSNITGLSSAVLDDRAFAEAVVAHKANLQRQDNQRRTTGGFGRPGGNDRRYGERDNQRGR